MSDFNQFNNLLQKHITKMFNNSGKLFVVDVDKDEFWNLYLDSFPPGTNEIFRQRREYDCSCCRTYVKNFGGVVAIVDNEIVTIWDFDTGSETFQPVADALAAFVKTKPVVDVFVTKYKTVGTATSTELAGNKVISWNHFQTKIPITYVSPSLVNINEIQSEHRTTFAVFKRSLEEISPDALQTVVELIDEAVLYRGAEWRAPLNKFKELQLSYRSLPVEKRDLFVWVKSTEIGGALTRIKNHSIGTLLMDLTNGVDVETAIRKYEALVAPQNYKRPKAVFTKKMVEDAQKTIEQLGFGDSLGRRFANLSDITINNILFANRNAKKRIVDHDVFTALMDDAVGGESKPTNAKSISIEDFVEKVLPKVTSFEAWVDGSNTGNFVSLVAPKNADAPTMFKWDNGFSWAYNGNVADSMKERVKAAGGKVDGVLRFSIQWNEDGDNNNDFDAHCIEPDGYEIYFPNKGHKSAMTGMLDVDIMTPQDKVAVENITWTDKRKMKPGSYRMFVRNYRHRGGRSGFRAEVEFDGMLLSFDYPRDIRDSEDVQVATVSLSKDGVFSVTKALSAVTQTRTTWGVKSGAFNAVNVLMMSPNYWDAQNGNGNKHWFFMLQNCVNDTQPNGFYNEFLSNDLLKHKHVFEALGSKMKVDNSPDQLSGLGFSSTMRNSLIVRTVDNSGKKQLYNIVF